MSLSVLSRSVDFVTCDSLSETNDLRHITFNILTRLMLDEIHFVGRTFASEFTVS